MLIISPSVQKFSLEMRKREKQFKTIITNMIQNKMVLNNVVPLIFAEITLKLQFILFIKWFFPYSKTFIFSMSMKSKEEAKFFFYFFVTKGESFHWCSNTDDRIYSNTTRSRWCKFLKLPRPKLDFKKKVTRYRCYAVVSLVLENMKI